MSKILYPHRYRVKPNSGRKPDYPVGYDAAVASAMKSGFGNVNLPPKGYQSTVDQALSGIVDNNKNLLTLMLVSGVVVYFFCCK